MKVQLIKEQAKHLVDLGVPEDKGTIIYVPVFEHSSETETIGNYYEEEVLTFTLTDLLEILPKEIKDERLCRGAAFLNFYALGEVWTACYEFLTLDSEFVNKESQELIDALYELLLWTIKEGYLKF